MPGLIETLRRLDDLFRREWLARFGVGWPGRPEPPDRRRTLNPARVPRGRKRRRAGGHGYSGGDGFVEI